MGRRIIQIVLRSRLRARSANHHVETVATDKAVIETGQTGSDRSCPIAWCNFLCEATAISGEAGIGHAAMGGSVTRVLSLISATLSSVMYRAR